MMKEKVEEAVARRNAAEPGRRPDAVGAEPAST